jgi:hypothetical protein
LLGLLCGNHRFNMELDLQSYLGSMCAVVLYSFPAFGLIYEGAIGQPRKTTSLCDPLVGMNTLHSYIEELYSITATCLKTLSLLQDVLNIYKYANSLLALGVGNSCVFTTSRIKPVADLWMRIHLARGLALQCSNVIYNVICNCRI